MNWNPATGSALSILISSSPVSPIATDSSPTLNPTGFGGVVAVAQDELEAAVAELPENYRTAKRQLREDYQPKINKINEDMMNLKAEIGDLKTALVETGVDVGPAIYLARVFDTDVDSVVKYFIFMLIANDRGKEYMCLCSKKTFLTYNTYSKIATHGLEEIIFST